jgi:hypothetical protein
MKHQITFVGGQLLPIYVGIKEFKPDKVHFIVSNESVGSLTNLKPLISNTIVADYRCNPYEFNSIKTICENILQKISDHDEVSFNLTGGTKIMVLACQAVIQEHKLKGFYINQDDTYIELPSYLKKSITSELTIQEFFDLSGHHLFSVNKLNDFSSDDFKVALQIESFANNDKRYNTITSYFRKKYNNQKIPLKGRETLANAIEVNWDGGFININANSKSIVQLKSSQCINLFFNSAWWELIVAKEVSNWDRSKELLVNCELPFKTDKQTTKNEIDILLNTGKKLIFIECKSGNVKQEDINKMKVIKQTYGGVISKSILVSRFMPSSTILEKCKELEIEVFYSYAFLNKQVNPLSKLISSLDKLSNKISIQ